MIILELRNITISAVGLEMNNDLAKGLHHTMISQNLRLQQVDKLISTLPFRAEKVRGRAREELREKTSAYLDPAVVSAGVQALWWWARSWWSGSSGGGHAQQGLAPSAFIPFGCQSHSFPKALKNESMGREGFW